MGHTASTFDITTLHEDIKDYKIGIIKARWNAEITDALEQGALEVLQAAGIKTIIQKQVPGSFELPLGAQMMIETLNLNAVIVLGCLIKGETPHFHYISDAVSKQIGNLNHRYLRPVIFGVLTVDTLEQARDRIGGKEGHKGKEAAEAALEMCQLFLGLKNEPIINKKVGF